MQARKTRIAIITNILPSYRRGFYDRLFSREDIQLDLFCQPYIPGMNFNTIHNDYPGHVHLVRFISARKEKVSWQFLPWRRIIRTYDVIFVSGNPRVISDLLLGTFCRIIGKKVVLWTMVNSYRGNKTALGLRLLWYRLFPVILVYTDKEVDFLRRKGFTKQCIVGMNNGLDQANIDATIREVKAKDLVKWRKDHGLENKLLILSSARLDSKNQFDLVIKALTVVISKIPGIHWILIGEGEEEAELKRMVTEFNLNNYVTFAGSIFDEKRLAPYFMSSKLFVHPSAVGLGLLHAFGYGLPVVIHGESEYHGPEYAAFINYETGINFLKDDHLDLAEKINGILCDPAKGNRMGMKAQEIART